jgi:hypothetical protein
MEQITEKNLIKITHLPALRPVTVFYTHFRRISVSRLSWLPLLFFCKTKVELVENSLENRLHKKIIKITHFSAEQAVFVFLAHVSFYRLFRLQFNFFSKTKMKIVENTLGKRLHKIKSTICK